MLTGTTTPDQNGTGRVMTMKGYSTLPKATGIEPDNRIVYCYIKDT